MAYAATNGNLAGGKDLLEQVLAIAHAAGKEIMAVYARDFSVAEKADRSPLTEADLAAHRVIDAHLKALTPDIPVLSEESSASGHDVHKTSATYWLVDPLDGTREFVKRNGEFTVNIALIDDGKPVLGVVLAPALDVAYLASIGIGAFRMDASGSRVSIHVAPHRGDTPWRVVASRSHAGPEVDAFIARLGNCELVSMGSSLKLCLVAEGKADVYPRLGPTSLWDTAAAQCIVEQAGGQVCALDGRALSYGADATILNPHFIVFGANEKNFLIGR